MDNLKSISLVNNIRIPNKILEEAKEDDIKFKKCINNTDKKFNVINKIVAILFIIIMFFMILIALINNKNKILIPLLLLINIIYICIYNILIDNIKPLILKYEIKKSNIYGKLLPNKNNPDFYKFLRYYDNNYIYEIRIKDAILNNWITFDLLPGIKYFANENGEIYKIDTYYILKEDNKKILEDNNEKYKYQVNIFNKEGNEIICEDYVADNLNYYCY